MSISPDLFNHRPKAKRTRLPKVSSQLEGSPEVAVGKGNFPPWLHRTLPRGKRLKQTHSILDSHKRHTVCEEAKCPNLLECYSKKTATFLALGKDCTRSCGFCSIDHLKNPGYLDPAEPERIAQSIAELGLRHAVITMVARDDLSDGGAGQLVKIVERIRKEQPGVTVELLTSDFEGNKSALDQIIALEPEIFNHNIETVQELTPRVRHKATYERTLEVLQYVKEKNPKQWIKSGLMVGLGETKEQVHQTLKDLAAIGCDIVTMGQYLQPTRKQLVVKSFVSPAEFDEFAEHGRSIGIKQMYCGPFVRSSYNAINILDALKKDLND